MMANEDFPIMVTDSAIVYENAWMSVREDKTTRKGNAKGIYAYLEVPSSVAVIAVNTNNEICIIESYRHPVKAWKWELPGGGSEGGDLLESAKRELEEETGVTSDTWHFLGKGRVCTGLSTEYQHNFVALNGVDQQIVQLEEEVRAIKFVTLEQLDAMIEAGQMDDNQSIAALYMYKNWLRKMEK